MEIRTLPHKTTNAPNPNDPLPEDPSCSLLMMQRGRSLDEKNLSTAEPRRRLSYGQKSSSLSKMDRDMIDNDENDDHNKREEDGQVPPPPPSLTKKKSKGHREMRDSATRGLNHISSFSGLSLPAVADIYISTAAATGNVRELKRLGKLAGANVNGKDARGRTAAHIAIEEGQLDSIRALDDLGADLDSREEHGATPAYVAASRNFVAALYLLAELQADVELPTSDGATPAYIAAYYGYCDVLIALEDLDADLDRPMSDGATPMYIAAANGQVEAIKTLHRLGANLDSATLDGATPAYIAAQDGKAEALKVLGELGADLNVCDDDGASPLCIACQEGQIDAMQWLMELGADLDLATNDGATAACIAAKTGRVNALRLLGSYGANLNKANLKGVAPVHIAAFCGNIDSLRALDDFGADLNLREAHGASPAFIAAANNQVHSLLTLRSLGAQLDTTTIDKIAPVHIAAANGQMEALNVLLSLGCDLNTKTRDGATPALLAAKNGHVNTLKCLLERGATVPDHISSFVERFSFKDSVRSLLLPHKIAHLRSDYFQQTHPLQWSCRDVEDYLFAITKIKSNRILQFELNEKLKLEKEEGGRHHTDVLANINMKEFLSLDGNDEDDEETKLKKASSSLLSNLLDGGEDEKKTYDDDDDGGGNEEHMREMKEINENYISRHVNGRSLIEHLLKGESLFEEYLRPIIGRKYTEEELIEKEKVKEEEKMKKMMLKRMDSGFDLSEMKDKVVGLEDDDDVDDVDENINDEEDEEEEEKECDLYVPLEQTLVDCCIANIGAKWKSSPVLHHIALLHTPTLKEGSILLRPSDALDESDHRGLTQCASTKFHQHHSIILPLSEPPHQNHTCNDNNTKPYHSSKFDDVISRSLFKEKKYTTANSNKNKAVDANEGAPTMRTLDFNNDERDSLVLVCMISIESLVEHRPSDIFGIISREGSSYHSSDLKELFCEKGVDMRYVQRKDLLWDQPKRSTRKEESIVFSLASSIVTTAQAENWRLVSIMLLFANSLLLNPNWRDYMKKHDQLLPSALDYNEDDDKDDNEEEKMNHDYDNKSLAVMGGIAAADIEDEEMNNSSLSALTPRQQQRQELAKKRAIEAEAMMTKYEFEPYRHAVFKDVHSSLEVVACIIPLALSSHYPLAQWSALRIVHILLCFSDVKPDVSAHTANVAMQAVIAMEQLNKGFLNMKSNEESSCIGTWLEMIIKTQSAGQTELQEVLKRLDPWGIACSTTNQKPARYDVLTPIFVAAIRSVYRYGHEDPVQAVKSLIFTFPTVAGNSLESDSSLNGSLPFGTCRLATILAGWLGNHISHGGEGSDAILLGAWQQAMGVHSQLQLPVAQLLFLLPPPPTSNESVSDASDVLSEAACQTVLRDPWWLEAPSSKLLAKFHGAATTLVGGDKEDEPTLLRVIYKEVLELRNEMQSSILDFPLPVFAKELKWKSESEEKEDEEARWMAGETPDPLRATQETKVFRKSLETSLCHMFDNLHIHATLIPTRTTPGLWAGIDNFGLNKVDMLMDKMKTNVEEITDVVGPLLAHAAAQFMSMKINELRDEGASLLDGEMLRLELISSFDTWLCSDVKKTVSAILIAQVDKIQSHALEVEEQLTDVMNKIITVSFSASKFLKKSQVSSSSGGHQSLLNMSSDCKIALRSLTRKHWKNESMDIGSGMAAALLDRVIPEESVNSVMSSSSQSRDESLESHYFNMEDSKQVTLDMLSSVVGSVARDAAAMVTNRLTSTIYLALEDIALHLTSCRAILQQVRKMDLKYMLHSYEKVVGLRSRCSRLLTRISATPSAHVYKEAELELPILKHAPRYSFEANVRRKHPMLFITEENAASASCDVMIEEELKLSELVGRYLLINEHYKHGSLKEDSSVPKEGEKDDKETSRRKSLNRFKAAGKKAIVMSKISSAFSQNSLVEKSKGLTSLASIGAAIRDITTTSVSSSSDVSSFNLINNGHKNHNAHHKEEHEDHVEEEEGLDISWTASMSYLCSTFLYLHKQHLLSVNKSNEENGTSGMEAPPLPKPAPFMLPGGVRASCIYISTQDKQPRSQPQGKNSRFPPPPVPVWALFQIRRPPSVGDLSVGSSDKKTNSGVYRVIVFLGSEASENTPDWLADLFAQKDEMTFVSDQLTNYHGTTDPATSKLLKHASTALKGVQLQATWYHSLLLVLPAILREVSRTSSELWVTGHGIGGAYGQLLQLLLSSFKLSANGFFFGAPLVVGSDPQEKVPLVLQNTTLVCAVLGHDPVPRITANRIKDFHSLTQHEKVQLRRIEQYSPRLKKLLSSGSACCIPFGDYYFIHPSLGISSEPISQWYSDPSLHFNGQKLLRRLVLPWSVIPLAHQLNDVDIYCQLCLESAHLEAPPELVSAPQDDSLDNEIVLDEKSILLRQKQELKRQRQLLKEEEESQKQMMKNSEPKIKPILKKSENGHDNITKSKQRTSRFEHSDEEAHEEEAHRNKILNSQSTTTTTTTRRRRHSRDGTHSEPHHARRKSHSPASHSTTDHKSTEHKTTPSSSRARSNSPKKEKKTTTSLNPIAAPAPFFQYEEEEEDESHSNMPPSQLSAFLSAAKLTQHISQLNKEGYLEIDDLEDADDSDLIHAGMKKPEIRRLRRYLQEM